MQYRLIESGDKQTFESKVNYALEEGWSLHGDTRVQVVLVGDYRKWYSQAMIKMECLVGEGAQTIRSL